MSHRRKFNAASDWRVGPTLADSLSNVVRRDAAVYQSIVATGATEFKPFCARGKSGPLVLSRRKQVDETLPLVDAEARH